MLRVKSLTEISSTWIVYDGASGDAADNHVKVYKSDIYVATASILR